MPFSTGISQIISGIRPITSGGGISQTGITQNPAPQSGVGPYGGVPGPISVPPNIFQQLSSIYPNLSGTTAQAAGVIGNELAGQLSPETISALQDEAAAFGVSSGMPGSQFSGNRGLRNLGLNVEQLQNQGATSFLSALGALGSLQTDPNLAAAIANRNALMGAAPNPAEAAGQAKSDFYSALSALQHSIAGPAGGTGGFISPAGSYGSPGYSRVGSSLTGFQPGAGGAPEVASGGGIYPGYNPTGTIGPGDPMGPTFGNVPASDPVWFDMGDGTQMNIYTGEVRGAPQANQPQYDFGLPTDTSGGGGEGDVLDLMP